MQGGKTICFDFIVVLTYQTLIYVVKWKITADRSYKEQKLGIKAEKFFWILLLMTHLKPKNKPAKKECVHFKRTIKQIWFSRSLTQFYEGVFLTSQNSSHTLFRVKLHKYAIRYVFEIYFPNFYQNTRIISKSCDFLWRLF